jgi:hypothetical protein
MIRPYNYLGYEISCFEGIRKALQPFEQKSLCLLATELKKVFQSIEEVGKILQSLENPGKTILRHSQLGQLSLGFRSEISKDLLLLKTSPNAVRDSLLFKTPQNSVSFRRISSSSQKEEQNPDQIGSESQTVLVLPRKTIIRRHGKLLKQVLFEIYYQVKCNNNKPVEWSPTAWLGERDKTLSTRASWSNTLRILIKKGLVEQKKPDRYFSSNTGNAVTYVYLTSYGYQYIIQLMRND